MVSYLWSLDLSKSLNCLIVNTIAENLQEVLVRGIPDKSSNGKTKTNQTKKPKVQVGQVLLLHLKEYNKYGQKPTDLKPCYVYKVSSTDCLLVPLSTKSYKRERYQNCYNTGSGKLCWLQLDSVTKYQLTTDGKLDVWYVKKNQLSDEMVELLNEEVNTYKRWNPDTWMK